MLPDLGLPPSPSPLTFPPDVVYDPVGGSVFAESTKCIAWLGRLLVVGFASGKIPTLAANRILLKHIV